MLTRIIFLFYLIQWYTRISKWAGMRFMINLCLNPILPILLLRDNLSWFLYSRQTKSFEIKQFINTNHENYAPVGLLIKSTCHLIPFSWRRANICFIVCNMFFCCGCCDVLFFAITILFSLFKHSRSSFFFLFLFESAINLSWILK